MTNEEFLEEILTEAHQLGIFKEVVELASKLDEPNTISSYQKALQQIMSDKKIHIS
jgi:cell fate (sporulation/competence/biofilm development) regulator YmcA (YheA/YmcA/DUF963 family)